MLSLDTLEMLGTQAIALPCTELDRQDAWILIPSAPLKVSTTVRSSHQGTINHFTFKYSTSQSQPQALSMAQWLIVCLATIRDVILGDFYVCLMTVMSMIP
jgi:hypothetical protein